MQTLLIILKDTQEIKKKIQEHAVAQEERNDLTYKDFCQNFQLLMKNEKNQISGP